MPTRLLFALLFLFESFILSAQVDAKLNAGSLITLGLNGSVEFPVSPSSSLAAGVAYSSINLTANNDEFDYRNLRFVPEFRTYFAPRYGHDRWFAGGYGKLISLRGRDVADDRSVNATRMALGVMGGHKWVWPSNFVLELNLGLGRGFTFSDNDPEFAAAIGTLTSLDLRIGILVGYRFGGGG
jgi:hypothetical protein